MNRKNVELCFFMCILFLASACTFGQTVEKPKKKLIAWGGLDWYSPAAVQMNIRKYEKLPFDGMVLQGFRLDKPRDGKQVMFDWLCFGREKFDRQDLSEVINTLKNIKFERFTDNLLRFNVTPGDVDWFDDFGPILHNAKMWASVARETGMKGWAFDVEDYKGTVFSYKKQKYHEEKTFEQYAVQARLRGRQFMEAVQQGYPDITILYMLAHSYVNRAPNASEILPDDGYGLLPAFINGMIEAVGPKVTLIDGSEQAYGYLTAEDFYRGYHSVRQSSLELIPPELHTKYRNKMDVGMAIYVNSVLGLAEYPGHRPTLYITPEQRQRLLEQAVYYALKTTDEYAWFYSELMIWTEPGGHWPTPAGTIDAVRSARKKIHNDEPLGFDIAESITTARTIHKEADPYPTRDATLPRIAAGKTAPKIDGVLNDDEWKDVPTLLPFTSLKANAETATVAKGTFDDEYLYLAFRCKEPQPGKMLILGKTKDDNNIWKGDCVEMFFRPTDRKLPFHFIVNPNNLQWDGRGGEAGWNTKWLSATKVGAKEWTAEVAIPLAALGTRYSFLSRRRSADNELHGVVQQLTLPGIPVIK